MSFSRSLRRTRRNAFRSGAALASAGAIAWLIGASVAPVAAAEAPGAGEDGADGSLLDLLHPVHPAQIALANGPARTEGMGPLRLADADEPQTSGGDIESYSGYDASYLFGLTRSVARSTIAVPGKVPLFVLTIPLDIVLLPFAAIGGFFS